MALVLTHESWSHCSQQAMPIPRIMSRSTLRRRRVALWRLHSKNSSASLPRLQLPQHISHVYNEHTAPRMTVCERKRRCGLKTNAGGASTSSPLQNIQNLRIEMQRNECPNNDKEIEKCVDQSSDIYTGNEETDSIGDVVMLDSNFVPRDEKSGIASIGERNENSDLDETDDDFFEDNDDSSNSEKSQNSQDFPDNTPGMFGMKRNGIANLSRIATMRPNVTEADIFSQIIAISMRHRFPYEATMDLFRLMISITNGSDLPSTKSSMWATLSRNDEVIMVRHLYCRYCHDCLGEGTVPDRECHCKMSGPNKPETSLSYFIQLSLEQQLKNLFSIPGITDSLQYRHTRQKENIDGIEDIYDGKEYRKECGIGGFLSLENNYSLTLNTDGAVVANSSKCSAWPVLFTVNELPPHARKRNMLLGGVWVDSAHPDLNALLFPIVKELRSLYQTGITYKRIGNNGTTNEITSKFITLIATVDSVARPSLLNMTQFNGKYGCTFCYTEGEIHNRTQVYPVDDDATCRTDNEIREDMKKADETDEKVRGVKGTSIVTLIPKLDLARGVVVESMHSVFLGVAKQHTMLLLFGKATDPWYRGKPKLLAKINSRLVHIRSPSRVSRKPRKIQTCPNWKASEWRNWLLYYGTLCMNEIIREEDHQHFTLLSGATYILSKNSISTAELQEARLLLKQYVENFENIFDTPNMTFNVHLLTHLTDTVENWGPLWAHSAFPFESFNKQIIDSVTSATARPLQIVTRFLMNRFTDSLVHDKTIPEMTRNRVRSILNSGKKNRQMKILNVQRFGTAFQSIGSSFDCPPNAWQSRLLHGSGFGSDSISIIKRATIKGVDFSCRDAENNNNKSSNSFSFVKNVGFVEILNIVRFHNNGGDTVCGLFVKCFKDVGNSFQAQHIRRIVPTPHKALIDIRDVQGPVIIITLKPNSYHGIRLANVWETD